MKAGTLVELPDGRRGRVTYHHLDGTGIKFDIPPLTDAEKEALNRFEASDFWKPDALLRDNYSGAWCECVGADFKVIEE